MVKGYTKVGMKALILVAENFQDEEFIYPFYNLQVFCERVDVASADGQWRYGKYGVPARVNLTFKDAIDAGLYDTIIIPGGFECPDRLRIIPEVLDLVRRHYNENKVVGAICHGPWVLISANVVRGKRLTGFKAIKDDIENAGGRYENVDCVIDDNLVTSPHYAQNPEFMEAVRKVMESRK